MKLVSVHVSLLNDAYCLRGENVSSLNSSIGSVGVSLWTCFLFVEIVFMFLPKNLAVGSIEPEENDL